MFQAVVIAASHSSVDIYDCGLYSALSSLVIEVLLLLQLPDTLTKPASLAFRILSVASIVAAVCVFLASVAFPRRPQVFVEGRVVDGLHTVSAHSRYTYGWATTLVAIAKKKKDLEVGDLPRPGHSVRSADQAASWRANKLDGAVWKSLLSMYRWPFIKQWTLAIANSLLTYLPWWITQKLLEKLERRVPGEPAGADIWTLVAWLGLGSLLSSVGNLPLINFRRGSADTVPKVF